MRARATSGAGRAKKSQRRGDTLVRHLAVGSDATPTVTEKAALAAGLDPVLDPAPLDLGAAEAFLLTVLEKLIVIAAQSADDEAGGRRCPVCHARRARNGCRGSCVARQTEERPAIGPVIAEEGDP